MKNFNKYINEDIHLDLDPYGEENWEEPKYTTRQLEYLSYVDTRMREFKDAYMALTNVWLNDVAYDVNLDELIGGDTYPFSESFDELNIHDWYQDFNKKYEYFRKNQ